MKVALTLLNFCFALLVRANITGGTVPEALLSWDNASIIVRGERIMFLSAEFHPFRLPSPGLWLDVFQKVKAMGFSGVSFYVMWALVEGERGQIRTDGVFDLKGFFEAAKQAGIYLLARPGPYINSEVSGGGFPGWLQRNRGVLRTTAPDFLEASQTYIQHIGKLISEAEITKGGPVIMFQPENEFTFCLENGTTSAGACVDREHMEWVEKEYRKAGITVPFISNDGVPMGNFVPGSGTGEVDIYGFDYYPFGWASLKSTDTVEWTPGSIPIATYLSMVRSIALHSSPRAAVEFQGGTPDAWGGVGVQTAAAMINHEFARIFYKMNYGLHTTIMNLYMTYGGTNWGNIGHPLGYTSYDVGAAISEDRQLVREKFSELKLQAGFLRSSPAFLTARPEEDTNVYTNNTSLITTPLFGDRTSFYVIRHDDYTSMNKTFYTWQARTSIGNISVPQLGGSLHLDGRDAKIHITDMDIGGINLVYSSAEVFTWQRSGSRVVLILYGGLGETHEFAVPSNLGNLNLANNDFVKQQQKQGSTIVQWLVQEERTILSFGDCLDVHLVWRNDAYNYWVIDLPAPGPLSLYTSPSRLNSSDRDSSSIIIKAGYLMRSASISGEKLKLVGDVNVTTDIEVISVPPGCCELVSFNGHDINVTRLDGRLQGTVTLGQPHIKIPDLASLSWRYLDTLPELEADYDDFTWTVCDHNSTTNPRSLTTPTSLYAGDYGYHGGSLLYRGHFVATGKEATFRIQTQGGNASAHSIWLNSTFLSSSVGSPAKASYEEHIDLPEPLERGSSYVFTVLIDHMGLSQNFDTNGDEMKTPRGILDYRLSAKNNETTSIQWKLTGNLGGEKYFDHSRGPLNEGALFAERQGYHLPDTPVDSWRKRSPLEGIQKAGVGFFATTFSLDMPEGYDIPLNIVLTGSKAVVANFRVQLFVNGWQYGKYVNNIGPQTKFPVPEGILNYNGSNYIALSLWSLDKEGSKLESLSLEYDTVVKSGYSKPGIVSASKYHKRKGAY